MAEWIRFGQTAVNLGNAASTKGEGFAREGISEAGAITTPFKDHRAAI